jgi:hypothetical protein
MYAIHELDDLGESTGQVHFYCSKAHALEDSITKGIGFSLPKRESEFCIGTKCETCEKELSNV